MTEQFDDRECAGVSRYNFAIGVSYRGDGFHDAIASTVQGCCKSQ